MTRCQQCHALFPSGWLISGRGKKLGNFSFCSTGCLINFVQLNHQYLKVNKYEIEFINSLKEAKVEQVQTSRGLPPP